ncbi:MAG: hypothetical protein OEL84_00610 [Nitrosopumilus sp.]|nr:hypothetical protein [Nitrosopumilus sp.]
MSEIDEIKKQRFLFLHELWKLTAGDHSKRVLVRQISEPLNLKEGDARTIVQYLVGEDLLEITTHGFNIPSYSDASLYIKHKGVVEVEQALSKPELPTPHFPASVVNNINIGTMTNSNISQASSGINQTITISPETKKELTDLINILKEFLEKEGLIQEQKDELISDISTIESQISSPKPKTGIISESLSSAKSILESASTIAITAAPIVAQITSILGMIR